MVPFNNSSIQQNVSDPQSFGVIILAGGKSSRMGTNKALLPINEKPVIQHICEEMGKLVNRNGEQSILPYRLVVTNDPSQYEFLGLPMVSDQYPGLGPLAGVHVGLQATPCNWNLVVACDMPMVTAEAGRFLLEQTEDEIDAVVPVIDRQLHPLFAVYHKRSGNKIEEMLIDKQLRMIYLLNKLRVKQVTESDFPDSIDADCVFYNMNTPEEWRKVKKELKNKER